jgi:acyl-CoA synthetase (AMP-forming)/AMP-acid ligase II
MDFMTFNDMLRRAAWRLPDQSFIYWSDRKRGVTYAQGDQISDQVAGALAGLGVQKGDRVGIFAHNGLDYVLAMFGAWKLGAVSAHISVLQKDNLAYFIHDSAPKVLIYTGDMHAVIEALHPQAPEVQHYICFDGARDFALAWSDLLAAAPPPPSVRVGDMDAAHLSYTSGSSGPPKGAVLAHGFTARATHAIAERLGLTSADVSLGVTSLASSYALVANLLPGVHRAVQIGVRKQWDAAAAWQEMDERGVTLFVGNPLVLGDLLKESRARGRKPSAFRLCVSGGAPLPPDLKRAYRDELGVYLVESYGQSELGGFVALGYPRPEPEERFLAIGPGLPDRETRVVDEHNREQPAGQPGELVIRGGVMLGYHNLPEKTAAVIRDGWLHTGDMGVMDREGYFTLLGRWSERIVSGGRVIYPRYMEEALLRHPAVHYAGVIAKSDPAAGQVPLGVVELWPGQSATEEELLRHCRAILGVEGSPAAVRIIPQMPMTPTGKIGKQDLIRLYGS